MICRLPLLLDPPYDIETLNPIRAPPLYREPAASGSWAEEAWGGAGFSIHSDPIWIAPELPLDEGLILVLDGDPFPEYG